MVLAVSESRRKDERHYEGHEHAIAGDADRRYLTAALLLLGLFMACEVAVSLVTGSLALLSDAGHMLSDVGAIAIALWTMKLTRRPAHGGWTWGWQRAEILSAAVNGITMLVVAGIVGVEAVRRLIHPPEVSGGPVLAVALVGVVVNIVVAGLVARANRSSLNVEGAYQHILTDLYGFIGTVIAGLVIMLTGWTRADPIASLVVCALMLHASWGLLRDAGLVLLEAAPAGTDLDEITRHLIEVPGVHAVHDLHVWSIGSSQPTLSAHVVVDEECFRNGHAPQLLDEVQACLASHFDVEHSSFQLEPPTHSSHELGACH
ncbi:cation diffusion facilitator family transporter [Luteococcus peritonei]|uniref:Cation diffusion facilitator family transporter n=1 Tax=Luteococcus peritonei TaxID=88874 RepID=A0ABW4RVA7_9ACTN